METPAEDPAPILHLSRQEMDTPMTGREGTVQLTRRELQQMMEEAGRKALVAYERRTATPLEREVAGKRLFQEGEDARDNEGMSRPGANRKGPLPSDVGSSSRAPSRPRGPAISRAEVDNVSKQIALLGKQIDELKKRGEIVAHHRNSPFANQILIETVNPGFRMPDLPKYDGTRDPQEHIAAFDMVMNLYGQASSIVAKLFVTTLTGKAQEWFTNLPPGSIESYEHLVQKFAFHFASKKKQKRSATHLFTIRQGENESLKNFIGRFNNETLEVQDLRIDMMTSILIHGLKKGVFASALARDPPVDTEQLMAMAQKYIDEEEMNAMKDEEWRVTTERARDGRFARDRDMRPKKEREKEPPYQPKYSRYTPLNMTRAKALMMVEKDKILMWPKHTRVTPAKRNSNKYCRFHRERGHDTEECYQLKDEIERLVRQGYFRRQNPHNFERRHDRRGRSRSRDRRSNWAEDRRNQTMAENAPVKGIIHTIAGGSEGWSRRARRRFERETRWERRKQGVHTTSNPEIVFGDQDAGTRIVTDNDPMVIRMDIANFTVHKVLIDNGSLADIIFKEVLNKMGLDNIRLEPVNILLVGFGGSEVASLGTVELPVSLGEEPERKTLMVKFLVVDMPFAYNVILGRPGLNSFRAVVSTYHLKMKFPTISGIGEVVCDQIEAKRCYNLSLGKSEKYEKRKLQSMKKEDWQALKAGRIEPVDHKEVELIQGDPTKVTKIGTNLGQFEGIMITFLRSNVDMFAWDPSDFRGINPEVIVHRLNVDPSMRPVQQKKRTFGAEKNAIIEGEVNKLLKAGYVSEVQYTDWLANVVVVPKPGGKWRMCTDFTDLNKACPKDPYPLPRIDVLVDSTAGYRTFSMMDAYQGYHQIFMAPEDRIKTSFVTDRGIYCYNVMPFGLKNAGATYQRLVNKMFAQQIGKTMEVYVDDMLVKSQQPDEHLEHLKVAFAIMRKHGMKLNPSKCTFGVGGGKFLGYMVSERGIEANPEKIEAILNLKSPTSIKEVQKLTGRIASLNRFISRSADRNLHFFKILRKVKGFNWTEECEQAFQELKIYLRSPPLLANPREGDVLYLYLAVSDDAVSSVLIKEEGKVQNPVYYVSKMLQGAETRYAEIEKLALAVVVTARKLRPYFQSHRIVVRTNHPLRNILTRPEASGRMIKWAVELGEFDITYQSRTTEKAQILADFMVEISGAQKDTETWMLHVDGSSNANNGGAGILIEGPGGMEIEVAVRLSFPVTNNEAEYEALLLGLELALEAGAHILEVYTDSQLVAMQVEGIYETKERSMADYLKKAKEGMQKFSKCNVQQIPRSENERADALSKLGATLAGIKDKKITVMVKERSAIAEGIETKVVTPRCLWIEDISTYLREGILPTDAGHARRIKFKAPRFTLIGTQLYKRTVEGPLLKCLEDAQARYVLQEIHEGNCGNHSGARSLAQKVTRQGYFWHTMMKDCKEFVRRCEKCQKFASQTHTHAVPMTPVSITCPFDQWGIDIMGPFPPARAQKKFVIVAVEYFSKWVEAEAVSKITEREAINFIWKNIICRFGIPRVLISDNGTQFQGRKITAWLHELKIQQNFTAVGHPQSNGQTEVTNRTILQHLKARLRSKTEWSDELPGVLWAYRTTPRTSTGETPFSLVYGSEAVIPAEIGEESQRIINFDPETNREQRAFDLDILEEKREAARIRMLHHKSLMLRGHNRNLKPRSLQVGDLVLRKVGVSKHVGKLDPNWEGPFKVVEIVGKGTYKLQDVQGSEVPRPWNIQNLKKFYV
ncbi:UNVERIFIED_CONTAM: Retrovirus-related Pol polyprotein from transposon [Sesamum indicum]